MVLILIGNPPFVKLPFVNLYHTFINCDCAKYDKKHIFRANIIIWSIYNVIFQFSSFETSLRSKGPSIKDVQYTHFWAFLTPPSPLAYKRTFLVRGHTRYKMLTLFVCKNKLSNLVHFKKIFSTRCQDSVLKTPF